MSVSQRAAIGTMQSLANQNNQSFRKSKCPVIMYNRTNQNNQSFRKCPVIMYNKKIYQNHSIRKYQERNLQPGMYKEIWTSQHSADDVRNKNEEPLENLDVARQREVSSNRLNSETILSIQNTDLFKEALGLLSDHWQKFKIGNIYDKTRLDIF